MTRDAERAVPLAALSPDGTFPRASRVRQRRDFTRIQTSGVRVRARGFTVVALHQGQSHPRLGCAISKRVGNSPVRNRVRRLVREVFRRLRPELPPVDFVVIANPAAAELARAGLAAVRIELEASLIEVGKRAEKRGVRP